MHWTGWIAIGLAVILGGWLSFDGLRVFMLGDYVTPRSGEYAGQLGPWASLVRAVGLDPRSPVMKGVHVVIGVLWLVAAGGLAAGLPWGWWGMAGCAVLSLWYLPVGTVIGIVELVLLFLPAMRGGGLA